MPGAAIVRWEERGAVVLAVHGAFDGASAWALRHAMEDSAAREVVVDLTHAEEACEFAAGLFATWTRGWGMTRRLRFRPGTAEHGRLLAAHGLDVVDPVPGEPRVAEAPRGAAGACPAGSGVLA